MENEIANKFRKLEGRVDSIAARLLIHEMLLDTKKHAEILEAALKVARACGSQINDVSATFHMAVC